MVFSIGLLGFFPFLARFGSLVRGITLTKDGVGIHAVDDIQVPDLDVRVKGAYGDKVGSGIRSFSSNRNVKPFQAERDGRKHDVVMHVEIIGCIFVDVHLQVGHLVFHFRSQQKIVGGENLKFFSFIITSLILYIVSGYIYSTHKVFAPLAA